MSKIGPRILVVDDDKSILKHLRTALTQGGYDVFTAETGQEAREKCTQTTMDLIVLDIMLPDIDGLEICRWVREQEFGRLPIIVLSAKDNDTDQLLAFAAFADDYVTKPFSMPLLLARVKAHLRNTQPLELLFRAGPLTIDFSQNRVEVEGQEIRLSRMEYKILEILALNKGRIVSQKTLIQKIWPKEEAFQRESEITTYIHKLRRKINTSPGQQFIETLHGWGYRFAAEE